jgi:hypothetical protein
MRTKEILSIGLVFFILDDEQTIPILIYILFVYISILGIYIFVSIKSFLKILLSDYLVSLFLLLVEFVYFLDFDFAKRMVAELIQHVQDLDFDFLHLGNLLSEAIYVILSISLIVLHLVPHDFLQFSGSSESSR